MAEAKLIDLSAAADFLGPGAVEVPIFENEILDVVRRNSVVLGRVKSVPATGHPHRYFEQTAIASAAAVDPRNLSASATTPTRVERPAFLKAVTAQTNFGLFDKEVTQQQGQFARVIAQDIDDITNAVELKRAAMLWTGSDTSMTTPTTLEWMGALAQIGGGGGSINIATVGTGASIIDAIKSVVAAMVSQVGLNVKPTALVMNGVLADLIDQEAKAAKIELKEAVVAGVVVTAIATQAGNLPIITEPFMPTDTVGKYGFTDPVTGKHYYIAILTEPEVEVPVISGAEFNPNPRLFQLGLTSSLAGQYVAVKFDTLIVKGAGYLHGLIAVNRP